MGERIFSRYQYGIEAANLHGTAVAATKVLVGADIKPVPPDFKPTYPEDGLGVRIRSSRGVVTSKLVEDSISVGRMYFEGLPFFLSCGLKGGVVANTTNGVSTWAFTPALNTANSPDSFTLEEGDDEQAFAMTYGMFKSIKLTGEIDQGGGESVVKLDAAYFGQEITKANFTGSLSLGTYTAMSAKLARLYDDAAWNSVGNTEVSNTLRGFDLELNMGNHYKFFGSPNLFFDATGEGFLDAMLTLTLEGNSASIDIFDEWDTLEYRAIRLKVLGPVIGNTNTNQALTVDIYGQWEAVTPLSGESNNNNLTQALFHGLVDSSLANAFACTVVTDTNTV
jgi:hypothetical protein